MIQKRILLVTLNADALATFRVFVHLLLEACFNGLKHLLVSLGADETDGHALGAETTGTSDAMEVGVGSLGEGLLVRGAGILRRVRHVVVDSQVDAFNVNTTSEHVGAHTDTLVVVLERSVAFDTVQFDQSFCRD